MKIFKYPVPLDNKFIIKMPLRTIILSFQVENYSAYTVQDFVDLFLRLFKFARNEGEWKFYCEYADIHLNSEENLADVFARILVAITKNKNEQTRKGLTIQKRLT